MNEPDNVWLLRRRYQDQTQYFLASWDFYFKFYTVFLTFSVAGLGWFLSSDALELSSFTRGCIAVVFIIQTALTAGTSVLMARRGSVLANQQTEVGKQLLGIPTNVKVEDMSAIPSDLATWAGGANCVAMSSMALLWLYLGFLQ